MTSVNKPIDIEEVTSFIRAQGPASRIYIGGDSDRVRIRGVWWADYATVAVVHINGRNGCRIFGEVVRERDYDQRFDRPAMRLMTEVQKVAELYSRLADSIGDRTVEIHLDINPSEEHGSSCVLKQAIGYIRGTCNNIVPMVKPKAFAASYCADQLKLILERRRAAA